MIKSMRFTLIIVLFFTLFSCQTDKQTNRKDLTKYFADQNKKLILEVELIDGLSYPKWLEGEWQNTFESSTNNFVRYIFNEHKLIIRQGLHFQGAEKFIKTLNGNEKSESSTDNTYVIQLTKNNRNLVYEFKLESVEWTDEKVLTYSIVKDGNLIRDHLTSCQLVLTKI